MYVLVTSNIGSRQWDLNHVICNTSFSGVGYVNHGVPQGSTLGPTLFSIYMNDLPTFISNMHIKMYSDDMVLYCEIDKASNLKGQLKSINKQLDVLSDWCN